MKRQWVVFEKDITNATSFFFFLSEMTKGCVFSMLQVEWILLPTFKGSLLLETGNGSLVLTPFSDEGYSKKEFAPSPMRQELGYFVER